MRCRPPSGSLHPTTTNSSRLRHLILSHERRSGSYRPLVRFRPFLVDPLPGRFDELKVERAGEPPGDLALRLREVAPIGLEPIRPKMRAAFGIDQLHVDLYLVAETPHAAFQDITDPKVLADLLHIDRFPFEAEGGAA